MRRSRPLPFALPLAAISEPSESCFNYHHHHHHHHHHKRKIQQNRNYQPFFSCRQQNVVNLIIVLWLTSSLQSSSSSVIPRLEIVCSFPSCLLACCGLRGSDGRDRTHLSSASKPPTAKPLMAKPSHLLLQQGSLI